MKLMISPSSAQRSVSPDSYTYQNTLTGACLQTMPQYSPTPNTI